MKGVVLFRRLDEPKTEFTGARFRTLDMLTMCADRPIRTGCRLQLTVPQLVISHRLRRKPSQSRGTHPVCTVFRGGARRPRCCVRGRRVGCLTMPPLVVQHYP